MKAILLLIIGLTIMAVTAAGSDWEEHSVTIKWGESISISNYNITAVDFRPGTVAEEPEKCDNEPDPYKRKLMGCDDWVLLSIFKDGNHVLDAALTKVNHTYADGAVFYNETTYNDDESSLRIIAQDVITGYNIPTPYADLKILVKANESYFDIAKNLTITKIVPEEAFVDPCHPLIPVSLSVKNIGTYNISSISVQDHAGDSFISESHDLNWSISLDRGEMWQTQYLIKPINPVSGAKYDIPPAMLYRAVYRKVYNLSTGNQSLILRSSDINFSKTIDEKDAGNVTVNLSVKNNGSRASSIKVRDSLLPGMEIVSGDMNFSLVLQPGVYYNQSYIIKLNNISGNITLPPANLTFVEYRTCYDEDNKRTITGSGISNPVKIEFASAVPAPVPVQVTPAPAPSIEKPSIGTLQLPGINGSLSVNGFVIPYNYLAILAGVLLLAVILFILKVWRLLGLFK
ncbi:Uncharacterised protein [uncultured archaeon]|nr:Uncharacterised protein [uncultured archaeon]